jgi:nitronate monooxygenase
VIVAALEHPIILAPMAGGPSTVALARAASEAGGLGFLAAGYRTAEAVGAEIAELRAATGAPFGVNLFVPGGAEIDQGALDAYVARLRAVYGDAIGEARADDDAWDAKLAVLREQKVPVVSFTSGCPPAEVVAALRAAGSEVWVTVTSPGEARVARDAGADALVVQGVEAGGHRGSFVDRPDAEGFGLLALLRLVAAEVDVPLVAAGGIGDGAGVAAALVAGAVAAQVGTSFLRAPEAGTNPAHGAALGPGASTAVTRAFTGRAARGVVNRFMAEFGVDAPIAYPHVHHATAPLRAAARERQDADRFNLWAGQAHALAEERPAGDIVRTLARDARAALRAASERWD